MMDSTAPFRYFRWDDLDQSLVSPKLSKLAAEMQEVFFSDETRISFEGRKRGNSAYFLPTFLDKQLERTDEWARRKYEIYCECLYEQGHCISPEFVRAVYKNALEVLFHVRKATIASHFTRRAHRTGELLNQPCLNNFARRMDVLANTWLRHLEAEARALEHNSYLRPDPGIALTSAQQARKAILDCESRLTEINIEIEAQKQALTLATSNGGPVSKILQAIRRLSVGQVNLQRLSNEYRQVLVGFAKPIAEAETAHAPSTRKRSPRPKPPCFETAVALLRKHPELRPIEFCREMDAKAEQFSSVSKYRPPKSWKVHTFYEQYRKRSNTVSRFLTEVRKRVANPAQK